MASVKDEGEAAVASGAVKPEGSKAAAVKAQGNIAHSTDWGTTLGAQLDDSDFHVDRKPGQRHPTPSPGAGDRVFYETLLKENPKSYIALKWAVEYGIFPREECEAKITILDKMKDQERQRVARLVAESAARHSASSLRKRARKEEDEEEDDAQAEDEDEDEEEDGEEEEDDDAENEDADEEEAGSDDDEEEGAPKSKRRA